MPTRPIRDLIRNQHIVTVTQGETVFEAVTKMREHQIGSVLVVDGEVIKGIFTERDALFRVLAARLNPDQTLVAEVMTRNPVTIDPDRPVVHALHMMNEGGFRHMPVAVKGRAVGVVSIRDAMAVELFAFEQDCERKQQLAEIMA